MSVVEFTIKRQNAPEDFSYWQNFEIPFQPGMTVAQALKSIQKQPYKKTGEAVAPVVWGDFCLGEFCHTCLMLINGHVSRACEKSIEDLQKPIRLEPLTKFPVQRDLCVDCSSLFHDLKIREAWNELDPIDSLFEPQNISYDQTLKLKNFSDCTFCGACLEACPQYNPRSSFVGAAVINQIHFLNQTPVGRSQKEKRLGHLMSRGGITGCDRSQNCVEVCPQHVDLALSLGEVAREASKTFFKRIFG